MTVCSVVDCYKLVNSRELGLCAMHQTRLRRYGDIHFTKTPNMRPRGVGDYRQIDEKIAAIVLTQGYETLVDLEDIEKLTKHNWYLNIDGKGRKSATAKIRGKKVYMQHLLLIPREDYVVDHENRDSLDNRKGNLRHLTNAENVLNSDRSDNALGMTFNKREKRWKAYINKPGIGKVHLGTFKTRHEAEIAVSEAKEIQCP